MARTSEERQRDEEAFRAREEKREKEFQQRERERDERAEEAWQSSEVKRTERIRQQSGRELKETEREANLQHGETPEQTQGRHEAEFRVGSERILGKEGQEERARMDKKVKDLQERFGRKGVQGATPSRPPARPPTSGGKKPTRGVGRLRRRFSRGVRGKRKGRQVPARPGPHLFSPEGIFMLIIAFVLDVVNIILGILDFVAIGVVLGIIWNAIALGTVGLWLWFRTGQSLKGTKKQKRFVRVVLKRIVVPFLGNSIPLVKFFPFWIWSVWGSLDKSTSSPKTQEEPADTPQPVTA